MIIRVLNRNYFVQQTIPSEQGLLQYVCTNVAEDDGKLYRIVRIPLPEVTPELVRYLADIFRKERFRELVQYANEGEYLQVVTDCGSAKAKSIRERLAESKVPLKERLAMGEKLLERLILSEVPAFFALSALDDTHIRFTDSLDCCMTFELDQLPDFEKAGTADVIRQVRVVLAGLFRKEIKDGKLPDLEVFLKRIEVGAFRELLPLYTDYRTMAAELSKLDEDKLEPKSLPFRIWEWLKSAFRFLKKLFFLVVILMAVAYLVLSVRNFLAPTEHLAVYNQVGDLQIRNETEAAE